MKKIAFILMLTLGACSTTVPMVPKFPAPPVDLKDPAPLTPLREPATLADLLRNSAENFGKYHELAARDRAWVRWYAEQRELFEK